jgi:hypothetical protein
MMVAIVPRQQTCQLTQGRVVLEIFLYVIREFVKISPTQTVFRGTVNFLVKILRVQQKFVVAHLGR